VMKMRNDVSNPDRRHAMCSGDAHSAPGRKSWSKCRVLRHIRAPGMRRRGPLRRPMQWPQADKHLFMHARHAGPFTLASSADRRTMTRAVVILVSAKPSSGARP
jgi:hypothetical protein